MPPEIWNDINQPRTLKYDVYGFAILFWELITENEPFKNGIMLLPLLYAGMICHACLSCFSVEVLLRCLWKHCLCVN